MRSATLAAAEEYFLATVLCGEIRERVRDGDMEAVGAKQRVVDAPDLSRVGGHSVYTGGCRHARQLLNMKSTRNDCDCDDRKQSRLRPETIEAVL